MHQSGHTPCMAQHVTLRASLLMVFTATSGLQGLVLTTCPQAFRATLFRRDKCMVVKLNPAAASLPPPTAAAGPSALLPHSDAASSPTIHWQLATLRPAAAALRASLASQTSPPVAMTGSHGGAGDEAGTTASAAVKHTIFLGVDAHSAPYFALDVEDASSAETLPASISVLWGGPAEWRVARALELSAGEAALAATAVGVAQVGGQQWGRRPRQRQQLVWHR